MTTVETATKGGGNGSDTEQTVTLEDLTSGMLVINGEQTPLTGIFVDEYSGYMMVTMTDVAGAESFDWLVENEAEYVQILVLPSLCNREFDVKTETDGFALYSTYASAPLFEGPVRALPRRSNPEAAASTSTGRTPRPSST